MDDRGRRVAFLSHCLLDENVRYPGGAGRCAGVQELADELLESGVALHQMPCPEVLAWGGVRRRSFTPVLRAAGTRRVRVVRRLLPLFELYTRVRYARLARRVARDITSYRKAGVDVVSVVGVDGSPSCGVTRTLDLDGAVAALARCPRRELDRDTFNRQVVAANVVPGQGWFIEALQRRLARQRADIAFEQHDLLAELGLSAGDIPPAQQLHRRED